MRLTWMLRATSYAAVLAASLSVAADHGGDDSTTTSTATYEHYLPLKKVATMIGSLQNDRRMVTDEDKVAQEVLQQAVNAISSGDGADPLYAMESFKIQSTGDVYFEFETEHPTDIVECSTYTRETTVDLSGDSSNIRVEDMRTALFEGIPLIFGSDPNPISYVVNGVVGSTSGGYLIPPGPMVSGHVAAFKRQQMFFNPHMLLLKALSEPDTVSFARSTNRFNVIDIQNDVATISVFINKDTGFIFKIVTHESSPLVKDTKLLFRYDDWDLVSGSVRFPASVRIRSRRGTIWKDIRSSVEVNPILPDGYFDVSDDSSFDATSFEHGKQSAYVYYGFWELGFAYSFHPGYGPPSEIIPSKLYLLPSVANSLAIIHNGGVIIVECSASSEQGAELYGAVQGLVPADTPVTNIIQSHHHIDHAAGVREVVALSGAASLVVGSGVEDFWDLVLTTRDTIRPDSLQTRRNPPLDIMSIDLNDSTMLVNDPDMTVTVYHTSRDPHAADTVLALIETDVVQYLYVVDFINAGIGLQVVLEGGNLFFDALRDIGLINASCESSKPLIILPGHGIPQSLEDTIVELEGSGSDLGCSV